MATKARCGSQNAALATYAVGETRWVERAGISPPVPSATRRTRETRNWLFEAAAFMAVPQSSLTDEPVRLWRIKRIA